MITTAEPIVTDSSALREEFLWVHQVDSSPFLHQFLSGLLISREVATIAGIESQQSMGLAVADHEVCHVLVVVQVSVAEWAFELDKHAGIRQFQD